MNTSIRITRLVVEPRRITKLGGERFLKMSTRKIYEIKLPRVLKHQYQRLFRLFEKKKTTKNRYKHVCTPG